MENFNEERACLCVLNKVFGFEPKIGRALMEALGGATAVLKASQNEISELLGPYSRTRYAPLLSASAFDSAAMELEHLSSSGCRFIGIGEPGYPEALLECEDPPLGLYYKGNKLIKSVSLTKSFDDKKYFNGYSLGSESEIKAAMYFMLKHYKNTYAYVNMHTQGRVIYAGKPNLSHEFNNLCINFGEKVSNITKYKLHGLSAEEVGEGNDGSATDFMAEIANGFIFSTKSGRLSTDKYINDSIALKYKYPVITLETTKKWTTNPQIFKEEYYNNGIRKLLFELIK